MGKTILTPSQRSVLEFLSKDPDFVSNFYFTGGTALAEYYLQHRLSEDLDFFSEKEIDDLWFVTLTQGLRKYLKVDKVDSQKSFNRNLVFISIKRDVVKTEFTYYPFERIEKPKMIGGIKVDSLIDLAVNKFFTIYQKPTARHFIDLYLIIKKGAIDWGKLSNLARIKFDTIIDPLQLGSNLVQAKEVTGLPVMLIKLDEDDWRNYFYDKAIDLKSEFKK